MFTTLDLPDFSQANVLVFGDLMLDRYWSGPSERVSPEAPVPVVKVEDNDKRPGGAANVALNLSALGVNVSLLGVVGKDQEAIDLTAQLEAKKISCCFHYLEDGPTISKLRVFARNQQMLRMDFESNLDHYDDQVLLDAYVEQLEAANVVILSDYGKGTLKNIPFLIEQAQARNIPVLVDPKGNDYRKYAGATLITPNLKEFEAVVGPCVSDDKIIEAKSSALMRTHSVSRLLVTRGKDGMSLVFSDGQPPIHLRANAREVFDVTGAGDTVIAMMAAAFSMKLDDERSAYLANLAAGLVVGKVGAACITVPELRNQLRNELDLDQGILSKEALLMTVLDAKARGEKIVMTNGCFDILHAGHIQYLNQARSLGDRLIVAVNTDASVKRLKGITRPVNQLQFRMEVLGALRAVDWVVFFDEDTPQGLIEAVMPDCLVKGGDYVVEQIAGHQAVLANGGAVEVLSFREGHSTTDIVKKLKAGK